MSPNEKLAAARRRYVALVRGINVGGRSVVRMADLRKLFESVGLTEVSTCIQSGYCSPPIAPTARN